MLTKEQIEQAAEKYCTENRGSGFEFQAFVTGAEWAAAMQTENDLLKKDNHRLFEQAAALQAENAKLNSALKDALKYADEWRLARLEVLDQRGALRKALVDILRIAERGDVNIQPLLIPIIEKANAALDSQ